MRLIDYITQALHNIGRQKLRSVLTIFAVVIGATSVTIMLTIVFSAKGFINSQFEQNGTFQQVEVSPQQDISWGNGNNGQNCDNASCVKLTDSLISQITAQPHVIGVARETQVNGIDGLFFNNQKLRVNQVVAYDANGVIQNTMVAGRDINSTDTTGVLTVSSDYADALGYKHNEQALVGQTVTLHTQGFYSGVGSDPVGAFQYMQTNCANNPGQNCMPPSTEITGKVIGVASNGGPGGGGNNYTIRVPLAWARGMEETQRYQTTQAQNSSTCQAKQGPCPYIQPKPELFVTDELATNGYSSLIVKADEASNASSVAQNLRTQFKVGAADAETSIKQQLSVFNILGLILGGIGGIALFVAAVGVINTMVMSILERTREIGVMRAVGARRATVSRLFTIEASLLGLLGGILGIVIAYCLTLVGNPIINNQLKGNGITSSNILSMPLWLIVSVIVGTTIIGMLAGLYPARKAARLDPVEALHYE